MDYLDGNVACNIDTEVMRWCNPCTAIVLEYGLHNIYIVHHLAFPPEQAMLIKIYQICQQILADIFVAAKTS